MLGKLGEAEEGVMSSSIIVYLLFSSVSMFAARKSGAEQQVPAKLHAREWRSHLDYLVAVEDVFPPPWRRTALFEDTMARDSISTIVFVWATDSAV